MKVVRKVAKFGSKNNQRFYHESFDNYKEFYDKIMERQPKAKKTLENILDSKGKSWIGVNSVEEAKNLFLNGWKQNVEKLKKQFNQQLTTLEDKKPHKMISSIAGFMPIVPNALCGLPNSMIDTRVTIKKSKILRFLISIDRGSGNSVDTIIKKMSNILAYVAMLERSGQYRCRIEVFFPAYGDTPTRTTKTSASVLVKNENQLFDIKRLCFPIIHPAMLRLFMLAWQESLTIEDEYHEDGYGASFEYWMEEYKKDFINVINENNEKIICLDLNSEIENIEKEVK